MLQLKVGIANTTIFAHYIFFEGALKNILNKFLISRTRIAHVAGYLLYSRGGSRPSV